MSNQLELNGIGNVTTSISPDSVTFRGASKTPYYRWYPYLEGFSPGFVRGVIHQFMDSAQRIIDPFAGTAVTGFVAAEEDRRGLLCELNPVMQRLFQARYRARKAPGDRREAAADSLRGLNSDIRDKLSRHSPDPGLRTSFESCFGEKDFFPKDNFEQVLRFRSLVDSARVSDELVRDLLEVAGLSSLLSASRLKRAGDVRYMTEKELASGLPSFVNVVLKKIDEICSDLESAQAELPGEAEIVCANSKSLNCVPPLQLEGLITSPPYVNGTNYFRNTRLELWFTRTITSSQDLRWFRDRAVTAGINGVTKATESRPPTDSVAEVVRGLEEDAYDRRIPIMVAAYFAEMKHLFELLGRHLCKDATVAIDIGDSMYAGVHVPADELLAECLDQVGYEPLTSVTLRIRHSNTGEELKQALLILKWRGAMQGKTTPVPSAEWEAGWTAFQNQLPHQNKPYSKRSWGSYLHSLCSYPGKLKPAIAYHLVDIFSSPGARILDPFAGVGTIPLEAALNGRENFGLELSPAAYVVAQAKVNFETGREGVKQVLADLQDNIKGYSPSEGELAETEAFGLNGKIAEYYHKETLREILAARTFFGGQDISDPATALAMAGCLHVLHGNRPYALSRRSHPLTPYSPSGEFEYRPLIPRLTEKLERTAKRWEENSDRLWEGNARLSEGTIYLRDATKFWPTEVDGLDAVITSPPFYDSTRFHTQNWLRLWFAGWSPDDFRQKPNLFIDERQKESFHVYDAIFRQARERLKSGGVMVFHLGKSRKCDMAAKMLEIGKKWFPHHEMFDESVAHCEAHGMKDKGTTSSHQYLVLY